MIIKDIPGGTSIVLSKACDTNNKLVKLIHFCLLTLFMFCFSLLMLLENGPGLVTFIIIFALFALNFFAGYPMLHTALQKEILIITREKLAISNSGFLNRKVTVYNYRDIYNLRFREVGKPDTVRQDFSGQVTGNGNDQPGLSLNRDPFGEKRILFDYKGKTIAFGENIYSWDFDELKQLLYEYAGRNLGPRAVMK